MIYLEQKYLMLASSRLDRFRVLKNSPFLANFRCPFCGDSERDRRKARGYVYEKNARLFYSCKNCGHGTTAEKVVQHLDTQLHQEFVLERFRESVEDRPDRVEDFKPQPVTRFLNDWRGGLVSSLDLPCSHTARRFLERRRIPKAWWDHIWYADSFKSWVNTIVPHKFENVDVDEPRIVISFLGRDGNLIAIQGRELGAGNKRAKYITIRTSDTVPHVFGLDRLDVKKRSYALEGPFDAMFLPNAIASAGSSITQTIASVIEDPALTTVVFDNEPRNLHIVKGMESAAHLNYGVFVWPDWVRVKDINELATPNYMPYVKSLVDRHTHYGLEAVLAIRDWEKTGEL